MALISSKRIRMESFEDLVRMDERLRSQYSYLGMIMGNPANTKHDALKTLDDELSDEIACVFGTHFEEITQQGINNSPDYKQYCAVGSAYTNFRAGDR